MYSIPVHALRFAAHCRSRLRLAELTQADSTRVSADAAKIWIRLARPHLRSGEDCVPQRLPRSRS